MTLSRPSTFDPEIESLRRVSRGIIVCRVRQNYNREFASPPRRRRRDSRALRIALTGIYSAVTRTASNETFLRGRRGGSRAATLSEFRVARCTRGTVRDRPTEMEASRSLFSEQSSNASLVRPALLP
jgi:hypothetical protein